MKISNWEEVTNSISILTNTYRLKVPGGWIYRYNSSHTYGGVTMVFVPDLTGAKK